MRIVVSGAAGFVGSHFCDRLLAEGHTVVALDNFLTGAPRNIAHLKGEPRFSIVDQDITQPFTVEGTSECYGDPTVHPQVETYWGNVNPVGPRSCYDESKRFAEALTMAYHRKHGVRTNIARIFNTYGPRMKLNDGRVVPAFVDQALRGEAMTIFGDGSQTRSFCYVSDLVDGLYRLMLSDERYPVNLGNPREMTILEFADHIQRMTGSRSKIAYCPLPEDDPKQRQPDIGKARALLGWEPRVPLEEGLRQTVEYFRSIQATVA